MATDEDFEDNGQQAEFESSLRNFLDSPEGKKHRTRAKRLRAILDNKAIGVTNRRRSQILSRLRAHAVTHLREEGAVGDTGAIDWSSIDWNKLLDFIIKLLPIIMALFGM